MTEHKVQIPKLSISNIRENLRSKAQEDKALNLSVSKQQPDQTSDKSFENTPMGSKAVEVKIAEAARGLRELQERINTALKRSSSATSIRPQNNTHLSSALDQSQSTIQKVCHTETVNETMEMSFAESKSRVNTCGSFVSPVSAVKPLPHDISLLPRERGINLNAMTPTASSTSFYLGGLNTHGRTKEELLTSIKNYQVKTVHTLDSSRKHYSSQNTTQNVHERSYVQPQKQMLGSSVMLKSFTTQAEFQPGYDKEKLDSMISKIMQTQQNYTTIRHESFVSPPRTVNVTQNVTRYENLANSRVYEPRVPKENYREVPQQYYQARPLQPVVNKASMQTVQMVYQKPANQKQVIRRNERVEKKSSYCGEIQNDGDSMCDFIKENDDLLDFEEEMKPKKRTTRETDQENLFVKKVHKRQEIMNSKRQTGRELNHSQVQRPGKEFSYKNHASQVPLRGKRRV